MTTKQKKKIAVVGGGLVGAACACMLAQRGFCVDVVEMRSDVRGLDASELSVGRSINLALSARGRATLKLLGVERDVVERHAIPMHGRMLHDRAGRTRVVPYGRAGQCIYSVGRRYLLETLLNAAERHSGVRLLFDHKVMSARLERGELVCAPASSKTAEPASGSVTDAASAVLLDGYRAILGCDGAFSRIRQDVLRRGRFNFEQNYIEHGYLELCIPAKDGEFQMAVNYLHIWPRGQFMMIALPNQDRSYTVTLFMPFATFEALDSSTKILSFFYENFPDAVPLIGE